jgi:hypothetical protein
MIRATKWHIGKQGEPIFAEYSFDVEIQDEAAGEFVVLTSNVGRDDRSCVAIDAEDWPEVKAALNMAVKEIKKHEVKE